MSKFCIVLSALAIMVSNNAISCTDFRIQAEDGSVIVGRSMEFGIQLGSNIRVKPRDVVYTAEAQDGGKGLSWKSKYGMVYLDALGQDMALDGINEKGLSFEALYLPGFAEYQDVPKDKQHQSMPHYYIGMWILSNFATVKEVKEAVSDIYLYGKVLEGMGIAPPIHFAINDPSGEGIVIEYTVAGRKIYDNKIGVMTNSPPYDWQLLNLRNYVNLSPRNAEPVEIKGETFAATGQGSGLLGLPGDWTPPSRFVRTAFMVNAVEVGKNAIEGVNAAQHILNAVDITRGVVRAPEKDGKIEYDITEWIVIKDLSNKVLYYRTYDNLSLRSIDLNGLDFTQQGKDLKMNVETGGGIYNMTDKLKS